MTALLLKLRQTGLSVSRNGDQLIVSPRDRLTDELRAAIRSAKRELLEALATEPSIGEDESPLSPIQQAARQQVLAQLQANPTVQRAFVNRFNPDGSMIVTLAIRGVGTGELLIPAERFSQASLDDYAALLACIEGPHA
jgi:hypothetical protein